MQREILADVALHCEPLQDAVGFKVSGRGELHLSILIEKMRREGYEFQVTRPQVILKEEGGKVFEPYEKLTVDVDELYQGAVIEKLGKLKGQLEEMESAHGMVRMVFNIPTRGLLGYRSEFMTDTKGMGMMAYVFFPSTVHMPEISSIASMEFWWSRNLARPSPMHYLTFRSAENYSSIPEHRYTRGQIIGECSRSLIW